MRQTIRHAGGLALLRVIATGGGLLATILIPRLMGPSGYGEFSFIQTLSLWFSLLGGLGIVSVVTRYVPELMERDDQAGLRKLAGGLLALQILGGAGSALAYFLLARIWLANEDLGAVSLVALGVAVRTIANLPFAVLLGLNRAAQWGVAEMLRAILFAPLVFLGFRLDALRGACGGMLLTEVIVLAVGFWWGRSFLSWSNLRLDWGQLRPYLRFSWAFFVSTSLILLFNRAGGPFIHLLSGEFTEVGFYTIAFGAYLTAADAWGLVLSSLGPLFSSLRLREDTDTLKQWAERLLTVFGLISVVACATSYVFAGALVHLALGPGYEAVAPLITVFSVAGVLAGPSGLARVLAVVYEQTRIPIVAAVLQLITFAVFGAALFPLAAGRGISAAAILATAVFAGYITWGMRQSLPYSVEHWAKIVGLGILCSPLLWAGTIHPALRWSGFTAVFLAAAFFFRVVLMKDLSACWKAVRGSAKL
ncbi:MAG: oligosaccharide flippase family protein [Acidobacteriota bacterium]